jgi:hypothetical protein
VPEITVDKNSMLYWYPLIKDLAIPQPRTIFVMLNEKELSRLYDEAVPESVTEKVKCVCDVMFYPCFLRTDLASGKHEWKKSCFIDGKTELWEHILEVVEFNLCTDIMGLDFKAFAVREFIPMDSRFTAFYGDMPVNPERRYFIKDGKLVCHHPYWIAEAIEESKEPSLTNWREVVKEINTETPEEIELLTKYSLMVGKAISEGSWSVDFCKAKDGRWILIDMALAERSWHPEDCPHLVRNKRKTDVLSTAQKEVET